eukprot:CAMPEP_0201689102 /NCGR_PEP_ID=MMETSP0578-20130828/2748_1 /ASSEMBLY_ACC=CAM_ASM_000663 /TAXON_ID=267565 /ORGANISM="Skeletonema grethea, Strain CCMP 1804" /LENGTH=577 /DNA_ID=CAMNT_0048173627 /DNA_START=306 /DNA_END=2039 /DNA_ORIENTATION=+
MADSLVFDFPDPTPHFDFDNLSNGGGSAGGLSHNSGGSKGAPAANSSSNKKTSSKKSRALFKSRFMNKGSNSNGNSSSSSSSSSNNRNSNQQRPASPVSGYDSPLNKSMGDQSGTTATTASLSVGSGSFSPNRLQYGHSGNSKQQHSKQHNIMMMIDRTGSTSPKPSAAVAPPPNSSYTTTGKESPRFEFSLFDDTHSGMRKTLLSNKQPNPYSNLTSTTTTTTTTHSTHNSYYNPSDNNLLYTTYGLSSDRTAASGYISEVSEFSFDRVTVNTERTGMSSNVSWNFLEGRQLSGLSGSDRDGGGVLGALGSTDNDANGGNNGASLKLTLPDIDNLLLNDALLQQPNNGSHHHHHSNNGHRMNVFTGEIHQSSDQSVISEISEGIDGHDNDGGANGRGNGNGMDFINSILMEKYEGSGNVVQYKQQQQYDNVGKGVTTLQRRPSSPTTAKTTPLRKQSSNNNNTISTVGTSGGEDFTTSIGSTHEKHMQQPQRISINSTKGKKKTQNRSIFKAIIEDIQFCGMYFCGLDTTVEDDGQLTDNNKQGDLMRSPSKEARAKEMDSTFLGKFVNCASNNFK